MKLHYNLHKLDLKGSALTIGTFDGVHIGHQKILHELKQLSSKLDIDSTVLTFSPSPKSFFSNRKDLLISTEREKIALIEKYGIDNLIIVPFNQEIANIDYKQFIEELLVERLNTKAFLMGYDHRIGKGGKGDYNRVKSVAEQIDLPVVKIDAFLDKENIPVSSTVIRKLLEDGDVYNAHLKLTYPYTLTGKVIKGKQIGRTIGFPTANIKVDNRNKITPKVGVYAVTAIVENENYKGMLNIGYRPTVAGVDNHQTIELNIFDFNKDIYDKEISIQFIDRIRDEQKFRSLDQLRAKLHEDKISAISILE